MSFEIGSESRLQVQQYGTRRFVVPDYDAGLGATAAPAATAPWMVGLPRAGDSKDNTRIAYAKRDHDLAMAGNATAYNNLKAQATGSATRVGKAWYQAALNDVNISRMTRAPAPLPTPVKVPFKPQVLINPIVQQATAMGLKIQQTADGSVVAVDSNGAVVSKPLPVPASAVTDSAVVPTNAVQANGPTPPRPESSGILSILDKLSQQSPSVSSGDNFVAAGSPPPMPNVSAPTDSPPVTAPKANDPTGGFADMFKDPKMIGALAIGLYLLFATSSGRKR